MSRPPKSILDAAFKYRPAVKTDVSKTWAEYRKRMEAEQAKRAEIVKELPRIGKVAK